MDRFFVGIIGIPLAFLILYYRRPLKEFIGDIAFAEQYLGVGGTNTFIIILGFLTFILSLMYALGSLQELLSGFLGRFFLPSGGSK